MSDSPYPNITADDFARRFSMRPAPSFRALTKARSLSRTRHRYASHGLRFDMKLPTESTDEFHKRLNKKALEEEERKPDSGSDRADWFIGEARNKGSLHSDIWVGTAADLAERGAIGIYPVSGWWKDQPKRDRSQFGARYSLIVTIETEAEGVDIWTPVAQEIGVAIEEAMIEV